MKFLLLSVLLMAYVVAEEDTKTIPQEQGRTFSLEIGEKSPVKRGLSLSALGLGGLASGYSSGYGNGYGYGNSPYPSSYVVTNRPLTGVYPGGYSGGYVSPYSGVAPSLSSVYVNPSQVGGSGWNQGYSVGVVRPGYSGLGYPTYVPPTYRALGIGYPGQHGLSYGGYDGYSRAGHYGGYGF